MLNNDDLALLDETQVDGQLELMVFVLHHRECLLLEIEGVQELGYSVPVLRQNLLDAYLTDLCPCYLGELSDELEGDFVPIDMVVLVEAVYSVVLLDAPNNKPAFVGVQEEERPPVERIVELP